MYHNLILLEEISAASQIFVSNHKSNIPQNTPLIKECEIRFVLVVKTVSPVNNICILIVFQYIFSAFTTISVPAIRMTSLLWSSPSSCSVALMSP